MIIHSGGMSLKGCQDFLAELFVPVIVAYVLTLPIKGVGLTEVIGFMNNED